MRVLFACVLVLNATGCLQKTECKQACSSFYSDLELLDWQGTLRKSSLALAGRLPNSFERELVAKNGQAGFEAVVDQQMTEEPFFDRLNEIYNDLFLTDQYLTDGTTILDEQRYPNRQYFTEFGDQSGQGIANETGANFGIAREPLNIITHVVRNDRSFKEILTAPYTLVNAYSARSYGLFDVQFVGNVGDRKNLVEVKLPGIPHAGLLTTAAFLNRFPTSATNRNRHRSRYIYNYFLDVDVLLFGVRPISVSNIASDTPTMNQAECVACHQYVDPVAGTFQNWNDMGNYEPPERGWYKDMFAPGYQNEKFNAGKVEGLQWLASRVVQQDGFARATVKTMFKGLTGQEPMALPAESESPEGAAAQAAFDAQNAMYREISDRFVKSGYNLKTVVRNIVLGPYFRAVNIKADADPVRDIEYSNIGMGRFLTPEMLNRKIKATLALDRYWGRPGELENTEYLLSNNFYLIYYGGIDSVSTTTRIEAPNGISVNVARRMANELACQAVARDFVAKKDQRALVPYVEVGTTPENNDAAIRHNIQYLHDRMLGETLATDDPELERTYTIFAETLAEGQAAIADGSESADLPAPCQANKDHWTGADLKGGIRSDQNYTVRAWMAVVAYMLGDYKFLHE